MKRLPHPIPYQGSKRSLAPLIAPHIPREAKRWFEPFAGSAAMTIWAASQNIARYYVISDVLEPIGQLWAEIIERPQRVASQYSAIWQGQLMGGPEYFNIIRARYNLSRDPVDLLYLICRCVKNAVRFNKSGNFTQSVDKRHLGMSPNKMSSELLGTSLILKGRTEVRVGDWREIIEDASSEDFLYMDPPYLGTTIGRDKRYAEQLELEKLVFGLSELNKRKIPFVLSYDGMTGEKIYGPPLPHYLELKQILLNAGRSSQSTLSDRIEETVESLYVSRRAQDLTKILGSAAVIESQHFDEIAA